MYQKIFVIHLMFSGKIFQISEIYFKCDYYFLNENVLQSKLVEGVHFWTKCMSFMENCACLSRSFLHFISYVFLKQHKNMCTGETLSINRKGKCFFLL